jgi:hypothetical protein
MVDVRPPSVETMAPRPFRTMPQFFGTASRIVIAAETAVVAFHHAREKANAWICIGPTSEDGRDMVLGTPLMVPRLRMRL